MKRRDFLLGTIWGGLWGSIATLFMGKKEEKPKDLPEKRYLCPEADLRLGGQSRGKNVYPQKPILVVSDDFGMIFYERKLPHILWEGSDTLDFEHHCYIWEFPKVSELKYGCHLTYDVPSMDFRKIRKSKNAPRYLRVSVNGVYADNIIDLAKSPHQLESWANEGINI